MPPKKTVADYAAIAVAPILIFVMISSLAQFFVLLIYRGGFGGSVSWILLMYTMGSVAVARISIEQTREYSIGYAAALGAAALLVLSRYVGSPLLALPILIMIAYLSDRITYDCTLIDDSVDASGEGLIDSGRMVLSKSANVSSDGDIETTKKPNKHQPGRTVFYLALAALPLFGLGQFFLGGNDFLWGQSIKFLALYLFASLSLLVTTSFLGLRRYLRQREVEMPQNVSVAWLAGGLALIAIVLLVAYIAPLPGQLLASLEPPEWLSTPDPQQASSQGWGDEAAEESDENSAQISDDRNAAGKQTQGKSDREKQEGEQAEGDPDAASRDSQSAPPSSETSSSGKSGPSEQKSSSPNSSGQPSEQKQNSPSEQSQSQESEQSGGEPSSSSKGESGQQSSAPDSQSSESQSSDGKSSESDNAPESTSEQRSDQESQANNDAKEKSDGQQSSERTEQDRQRERQQEQQQRKEDQKSEDQSSSAEPASEPPSKPSMPSLSSLFSGIAALLKFILMLALLVIVAIFVYRNWRAIAEWWAGLFGGKPEASSDEPIAASTAAEEEAFSRPFSSFRNPIGKESDPRRVIVITFQAYEAWMRDRGDRRDKDETPDEFVRRVATTLPQLTEPTGRLASAYNRVVYGRGNAGQRDLAAAKTIWQAMLGNA